MGGIEIIMTIWKKKRQASGLSKMDMANELGLSFIRYSAIEKGSIKMPSNLIDKFNEIISRGKQNEIRSIENNVKADEFWNEIKGKREDGKHVLITKMEEFNIPTVAKLAELLGYCSSLIICNCLAGRNTPSDEFKKRLYTFFSDEKNIQIPSKGDIRRKNINKELDEYYDNTDFKKLLKDNKITCVEIAKYVGVHNSTICNLVNRKNRPGYDTIAKTKEYLDNRINGTVFETKEDVFETPKANMWSEEPMKMEDLVVEDNEKVEEEKPKENVSARYIKELDEIDELIKFHNDKIKELELRKKVCNEVLDVIIELTAKVE